MHSHCGRTAAASAAAPFALRWLPWSRSDGCLGRGATVCLSRSSEGSRQVHSHCGGECSNQLSHCGAKAAGSAAGSIRTAVGAAGRCIRTAAALRRRVQPLHSHCAGCLGRGATVCLSRSSEGSRQVHSHCGGECSSDGLSEQVEQRQRAVRRAPFALRWGQQAVAFALQRRGQQPAPFALRQRGQQPASFALRRLPWLRQLRSV